ncbi:hypothetical protein ARMSODRAFT_980641 [Armillaria solidipes]|uniref:Uncharacterized protein n=1 Tax=Armillaria solidipes TaxID=1076256 RepID=A0A2H3B973_9AGAR|nr:hypothetical protein ARMSODRAFT_980641 [Armillaria solidipes]
MDINDTGANPWVSVLTVPIRRSAEDMEADPSAGALIVHQHSFEEDFVHPAKRQADVNQQALPMYMVNDESSSCYTREGQLNEAQKAKEQASKELDEQKNLIKAMETRMKENEENMRECFSQLQNENERAMKQHMLQLKNTIKQKDNEIVTLNARVNAASSSVPQASTSTSSSSTGPASTSLISLLSSNSTSGAASSSTAPESSSQVLPSSTRTETTVPGTMPGVTRSPRVGTGRKAIKIVRNDVTLPISPFQTKEQTSGSPRQAPQLQEDMTMDEPDEYGFDSVTLNNASSKELLKMCAQLLQAAVSGKAQVRKEDVGRKYPSKKTSARMGQRENMSKAEINALQTFIRKQFLMLTDMTTLEEFVAYEPVDEAMVMELRGGTGDGPDNEDFTLDFSTRFARQKWAEAIPRLKKDTLEFETESEVVDCVAETGRCTQTKAQGRVSKNRKYKVRTEIVKKDGMSSEESHTQVMRGQVERVFLVKICLWRHEKIIEYMDEIDERGREIAKKGNQAARRDRETQPRFDEEVHAPTRLPESLYDPAWLESLDEDEREELAVSEEVFELLESVVPVEITVDEVVSTLRTTPSENNYDWRTTPIMAAVCKQGEAMWPCCAMTQSGSEFPSTSK